METITTIMSYTAVITLLSASYAWLYQWSYQRGYDHGKHCGFTEGFYKCTERANARNSSVKSFSKI